jgi:hypothetical protein
LFDVQTLPKVAYLHGYTYLRRGFAPYHDLLHHIITGGAAVLGQALGSFQFQNFWMS